MSEKVERKDCVETLSCALTEDQVAGYSQDMAGLHQTKLEVEDQKKEMTKDFGARIQKFESDIHVLSRKITTKKEARDVNCFWEFDYTSGEKTLTRTDTGKVVKKETISAIERQRYIEFVEKKNSSGEMAQAMDDAEKNQSEKAAGKCPHCGTKDGKKHFSTCPNAETVEKEVPEEDGPAADDIPESEDCFGTFASGSSECAKCDRVDDCKKDTPEETEPAKEEVTEEPVEKEEKGLFYTCRQCKKGFDEYIDLNNGEGDTTCPHCKAVNWQ